MRNDPVVTAPDGAFVIGGGFGQDIDEASVRSLFAVPTFGSGNTRDLFESQLTKLPLDALKQFKPMIPGTSDSQFSSVGSAVSAIMGSLVDGTGVVLKLLQTAMNQIIDIFNGLIVTPVNSAVQGVLDWFRGLLGWQTSAEVKQADLANSVWSGATSQVPDDERTPQEVRDAVAAMRARSEALRHENELRYRSSVPLWQGLIPGGDVTCSLESVSIREDWTSAVTGSSARTDSHDHSAGSYKTSLAMPALPGTSAQGALSTGPMATFRVRSDTPRNVVSFLAKSSGSITGAYVSLWSYDYDADTWRCVAVSNDFSVDVGTTFDWIDVSLTEEYSPAMSELMGVRWTTSGGGILYLGSSLSTERLPAYHSVPYGNVARVTSNSVPVMGESVSLTNQADWWNGQIPFAQIAPDLGQTAFVPSPQYWFDDFNTDTNSMYSLLSGAKIKDGHFGVNGIVDQTQTLVYRGQMSTPSYTVEATTDNYVNRPSYMKHSCSSNGKSGVVVELQYGVLSGKVSVRLSTVSPSSASQHTLRAEITDLTPVAPARWSLSFDDSTKTYVVKMGGVVVLRWADPNNLALRGKGKRSGGLAVSRSVFVNSGSWDDLLIYDHDLADAVA